MHMRTAGARRRLRIAIGGAMLALWLPSPAIADPSAADQAAAQELFNQARRLVDEGKYTEACAKFEGSQRLDPGGGTLLNLATCNQRVGRLATSWTQFNEALSLAIRDGRRDRISFARVHIAAVEPQLPHLTVKVGAPDADLLSVSIDGAPLGRAAWGIGAPIDPGDHVIDASAPGRVPFRTTVSLAPSEAKTVDVPPLVYEAKAAAKRQAPAAEPFLATPWAATARRIAGGIALGVGAVALGTGVFFGVRTMSIWSDANANCPNDLCNSRGESLTQNARSAARAADLALGIAIASVSAGAVLLVSAGGGSSSSPAVGVALAAAERGGRVVLDGAW
jgi:hypothetical protein